MRLSTVKEDTGIPLVRTKSPDSGKNFMYRKGRYVFYWAGGGGGAGASEGGSLANFSQIVKGQTCFIRNRGRVTVFFGKEKITPRRLVDSYLLTNTRSA